MYNAKDMHAAIVEVEYAISKDAGRSDLCHMHVYGGGDKITVEAVDGHRHARVTISANDVEPLEVFVPRAGVPAIKRQLKAGVTTLAGTSVAVRWPAIDSVIPEVLTPAWTVSRESLLRAAKQVADACPPRRGTRRQGSNEHVALVVDGIYLSLGLKCLGTVRPITAIPLEDVADGASRVAVDASYLLDLAKRLHTGDVLDVYVSHVFDPVVVVPRGRVARHLIMPVRW